MATESKMETPIESDDTYLKTLSENKEKKEEHEKYLAALNEYYKLKDDYDGENSYYHKKKISIRKDSSLSKIEKYKALQKLKENRPCINCNQKGGTYFGMDTNDNGAKSYIAMCLAHRTDGGQACDLNIEIIPKRVKYINDIDKDIFHNIQKTQQKIISSKLSLLFDLQSEDVVLKEFDDLKDDLDKYNSQMNIVQERLSEINSQTIMDAEGNPTRVTTNDYLKPLQRKLNDAIYEFKNRLLKVDIDNKNSVKHAFDTYTDISNTQGTINDVSYQEYFIDYDSEQDGPSKENPYHVIKNEHTIQQMEITSGEYEIVENKK